MESRDIDRDIGGFGDEFDLAEAQGATGGERGGLDGLSVNESAISGIAIPDHQRVSDDLDLAMDAGDAGVFDLKIIVRAAAQAISAQLELEHATFKSLRSNQ